MIEPATVTIGQYTYQLTRLPATKCIAWQVRLFGVLAPLLRELGANPDGASVLDTNVLSGLTSGVASIIEQMSSADPELTIITDLLALATVRHGRGDELKLNTEAAIDMHFGQEQHRAPITDMYLVAWEVAKANHFLPPQLTGILKQARATMTANLSATEPSTNE